MQILHSATCNLTLSGPGRPVHFCASDSCPASISFLISSHVLFPISSLTLLWMIPTLRSGFGKDTCGVRLIVHYGLILISTARFFFGLSEILSRLLTTMTTHHPENRFRLGFPFLLKVTMIPQNHTFS